MLQVPVGESATENRQNKALCTTRSLRAFDTGEKKLPLLESASEAGNLVAREQR